MRRQRQIETTLAPRYRELVRLAYLVLPADLDQQQRILLAHRVVQTCLSADRTELTAQVIRGALRTPAQRVRIGRWLRATPAAGGSDEIGLAAMIGELPPPARAAYGLLHVDRLPDKDVRDRLERAGVQDPDTALTTAKDATADYRVDAAQQRALLGRPYFDPTIVRLYGRVTTMPRPVIAAGVAVVLLAAAGLAATQLLGGPTGSADRVSMVAHRALTVRPGTWRHTTQLDLSAWEPRGERGPASELVRTAVAAWDGRLRAVAHDGAAPGPPLRDPQLLYAGHLDNLSVVLLREGGRVARYTVTGGRGALEVFPEGRLQPDAASPLKLDTTAAGTRYLLPPWVATVSVAPLRMSGPDWKPVAITHGVTTPVPSVTDGSCSRGPAFKLRAPIAHGRPYTMRDLGAITLARLRYEPPPPAPIRQLGPHEIYDPGGFDAWARVGCHPPRPGSGGEAATAWEFWAGKLPEGAKGRWSCTRYTYLDGGSAVDVRLSVRSGGTWTTIPTGGATGNRDCSRLQRDMVSGTWWKAPSGHWWYVAASSRNVVSINAYGPFTRVRARVNLAYAQGPAGGPEPGPVKLSAVRFDGKTVSSYQAKG